MDFDGVSDADDDGADDGDFWAGLVQDAVKKRPAANQLPPKKPKPTPVVHDTRPSMPDDSAGTTFYGQGKVLVSASKSAYRVFKRRTDRVDKLVRWRGDKAGAWEAALDLIDGSP